jgi:hypothetical protein
MDEEIDLQVPPFDSPDIPIATATPVMVVNDATATTAVRPAAANLNVSTFFHTCAVLNRDQILRLRNEQGFPAGLAEELGNTRRTYPVRFWVVDNSGSMQTSDGKQIRGGTRPEEPLRVVDCNRWTELQSTVAFHAELAGLLEATTVFRFLNDPGPVHAPQEFSVAETDSVSVKADVDRAKSYVSAVQPRGVTPLTQHVLEIRARIESVQDVLRSRGQQAVVVLATDGLPSNEYGESPDSVKKEFAVALKSLQSLPVWIVVRLCTDNGDVVDYFNDLDAVLELPLEVIDDFFDEAQEIHKANRWLNYGLPLHRCREMGYNHRIFDLLDERLLNKDELKQFLTLLLGTSAMERAPDPNVDWSGFSAVVAQAVRAEKKQWNPVTRKADYWVDLKQLEKAYGKKGFGLFRRN